MSELKTEDLLEFCEACKTTGALDEETPGDYPWIVSAIPNVSQHPANVNTPCDCIF